MNVKTIGYVAAFTAVVLWAGNFVLARAMATSIPPIQFNFWRWLVALICIAPFAMRTFSKDFPIIKRNLSYLAVMGFIGVTSLNALFYKAGQSTSSINMVLFVPSAPIVIMLLSRILCAEPLTPRRLLGLVIILVGLGVLISKGEWSNMVNFNFSMGDLWSVGGVMCFGLYSFFARYRPKELSTAGFHLSTFSLGLLLAFPMLVLEMYYIPSPIWDGSIWAAVLYAGVGCSFIAYALWTKAIDALGPVAAGMVYYTIPLFTALEGVLILGEQVTKVHIVGGGLMIVGIALAIIQKSSEKVK